MLLKLKSFLKDEVILSKEEIKAIRDYFNVILSYKEIGVEKPVDVLEEVYKTFKDIYSYTGVVYRGVFIDNSWNTYKHQDGICSFTNNKNVAENFAMNGDCGDAYLLTQEVSNGLDFAELLNELYDKGILLIDDIETFLGEDEVLCYVQEDCKATKMFTLGE